MPIPTSRTNENAQIIIDREKCNLCDLCVKICKDFSLRIENDKLVVNNEPIFGCFGCGQCAAICPNGAIKILGREFHPEDIIDLPSKDKCSTYEQLHSLMLRRRSVRDFKAQPVEPEIVDKIIRSCSTAPMGIPPSDVSLLILQGKDKVSEFTGDFLSYVKKMKWMFPVMTTLYRPFFSKIEIAQFKEFVIPLYNKLIEKWEEGEDFLLYNAPLVIYFYGNPYADPVDSYIPATYSMLVAESLGLGSCMIGSIAPMIKKGGVQLKKKYGIDLKSKDGIFVIYGYPKYKYHKAIKRTFAKVNYA
jgi:NAD-dependent dihydropyrimidine dehydrogenase PreA subunit/nitroreductase